MLWLVLGMLAGLMVAGLYLAEGHKYDILGAVMATVCGMVLVGALFVMPVQYYVEVSNIQTYHATKVTVESSREQDAAYIERAALTQKIIDVNAWLGRVQYWNQTIFDPYIPDEVMELEPLK